MKLGLCNNSVILSDLKIIMPLLMFGAIQAMVAQTGLSEIAPKTPQAYSFQTQGSQSFMQISSYKTMDLVQNLSSDPHTRQQQQNQMLMVEVEKHQRQEAERQKRIRTLINEAVSQFYSPYSLPSHSHKKGALYYRKAFDKLQQMDKTYYSVKQAVFIVENAFYEGKQDDQEFEKIIKQTGDFIREKMIDFGYDTLSNIAKNLILFQFFSDTLQVKPKGLKHLPIAYDFEDYKGQKDWSKMFVTKLLNSGTGQCHSLPLLYLILAEEIGAVAHLAKAPNHIYIKFPDDTNRKWYNVELTSNILTTNAHILQSGYIKAEAIQNKIFMHPLSKQQLFAQMLIDLAMGYEHRFGNDAFTNQLIYEALQLDPTNISAHLNQANYYDEMVHHVLNQLGITEENINTELPKHPEALALVQTMIKSHKAIDALGYKDMPDAQYRQWLKSMDQEKDKKEQADMKNQLKKMTKPIQKL
ncbi:hypothetical protein [Aquimarina macrocephali]|uniref:hypothetical protein n=1 Tax=Aquimarina macrocephali TaxID=666563 RepID=UPI003F667567